MWAYFPTYAGLEGGWATFFAGGSYFWYIIAAIGALSGLENILKNEFWRNAAVAAVVGGIAWFVHWGSSRVGGPLQLGLKITVLLILMIAVAGFALGVPHLFARNEAGEGLAGESRRRSFRENVVSLIVALLALLTATLQFYAEWSRQA